MTDYEPLLRWFADHDLCEDLRWTTHRSALLTYDGEESGEIRFFVLCNDMFWWATADFEWITTEDLPALQQAYDDLETEAGNCAEAFAPQLWVARKRTLRPQRPWLQQLNGEIQQLFCAAGPERDRRDEG